MLLSRSERVLLRRCKQVRGGMTMLQAETILGLPQDYSTKYYRDGIVRDSAYHRIFDPDGLADVIAGNPGTTTHHWKDETTIVEVHYGSSGCVVAVDCYAYVGRQEGLLGNLPWRIMRLWRRVFPE
jgi:hypothetical protein